MIVVILHDKWRNGRAGWKGPQRLSDHGEVEELVGESTGPVVKGRPDGQTLGHRWARTPLGSSPDRPPNRPAAVRFNVPFDRSISA